MNRIIEQLKRDPCAGPMPGDVVKRHVPFQHAAPVWREATPEAIERANRAVQRILARTATHVCVSCRDALPLDHDDSHLCTFCTPQDLS